MFFIIQDKMGVILQVKLCDYNKWEYDVYNHMKQRYLSDFEATLACVF